MTVPGTHRTPPDAEGRDLLARYLVQSVGSDALPALVAALAAHLTVDDRRALTRDLAAQDGGAVVDVDDALIASTLVGLPGLGDRLEAASRAAVEAARPTPPPEETR